MYVHTVQAGDNGGRIYDPENGESSLRRMSQASRARAIILRAFRPFFWLQAALGVAKLSIRKGVAISKSPLSRCYNLLAASMGVFVVYSYYYHLQFENDNVAINTYFTAVMVLATIHYFAILCVSKHTRFVNLFIDLSTFDDNFHASLNDAYESSLNGSVNWVIISAYGLFNLIKFIRTYFNRPIMEEFLYGFIASLMICGVDVEVMCCWALVEQVSGRMRMLRVSLLEQCLGGCSVNLQHPRRGGWLRSRPSREQIRSLGCRVSLANLPTLYNAIHSITRGINSSFMFAMIVVIIYFILDSTMITIIALTVEVETETKRARMNNIVFAILVNLVRILVGLTAVCVAYERLAIERSRLLSILAQLSLDSSAGVHPERARRARNITRAVISQPLSFSLCGVEIRASFIPTLLSLLIDCALLHFQLKA